MYSPKIDEALIPKLYRLKQSTKKPMTHLVNEAVKEYLDKNLELRTLNDLQYNQSNNLTKGVKDG